MRIRKGLQILSQKLLKIVQATYVNARCRLAMPHQIGGHKFIERVEIPVIDCLDEALHNRLVFF